MCHRSLRYLAITLVLSVALMFLAPPALAVGPLGSPASWSSSDYRISPDGQHAVYGGGSEASGTAGLYVAPLNPGPGGLLEGELLLAGSVREFEISADSTRVVCSLQPTWDSPWQLYSLPITGPPATAVKLAESATGEGAFQISPDGGTVILGLDSNSDGDAELWSVPIAGPDSLAVLLSEVVTLPPITDDFSISADGAHVVFRRPAADDQRGPDLYSIPIIGPAGAAVRLNRDLTPGGAVLEFRITPDGATVVYQADQDVDGYHELYAVPIAGPPEAGVKLTKAQETDGIVREYQVTPDSARVLYFAIEGWEEVPELYSVPLTGPSSSAVRISDSTAHGYVSSQILTGPDGALIVYMADYGDGTQVYSVPAAGPGSARRLLLTTDKYPEDRRISPDGRWLFLLLRDLAFAPYTEAKRTLVRLLLPPTSGPPETVNGVQAPGGTLDQFAFSPAGDYLVYRGERQEAGMAELYSLPIEGVAGSEMRLNGSLAPGNDVVSFLISPNGSRVVYRAGGQGGFELYNVPLDPGSQVTFEGAHTEIPDADATVFVDVLLTLSVGQTVTVGLTAAGTAAPGQDYTLEETTLSFAPGEVRRTIAITVTADPALEADESIVLELVAPENAGLGAVTRATLLIRGENPVYLPLLPRTDAVTG